MTRYGEPEVYGVWEFPDKSRARIQFAMRKGGREKMLLQVYKEGTWKTYQTLSKVHLSQVLANIQKKGGVRLR